MEKKYTSLKDFYPYYLEEHQHPTCRRLHFVGTGLLFLILMAAVVLNNYWILLSIPLVGYGFAWVGHFFFEKNKPATFQYPFYSLASDFIMFFDLLKGKEKFNPQKN
ncbi:Mpo1-like protein [Algoriphagus namhaensis]